MTEDALAPLERDVLCRIMDYWSKERDAQSDGRPWPGLNDVWDACARLDAANEPDPWDLLRKRPLPELYLHGSNGEAKVQEWDRQVETAFAWRARQ